MRRFGTRRGGNFAPTGPNLSILVRIGPFATKPAVPLASLTNATVSFATTVSPTFASPLMYRNLGINADLRLDVTGVGQFIWCEQLSMNASGRIMAPGVDGQDGDASGTTGDGGLGSSGGGASSAFEAEAGNGGTAGQDGQTIDFSGGNGTGNGSGGHYLTDFDHSIFGNGGAGGAGGLGAGAYYAGSGGAGGQAYAGGGGGGSEDLDSGIGSGGGGGGGGRPILVIGRTLILLSGLASIYTPGGNAGQGLSTDPFTGGGGGGGGGTVVFCFKRKVFSTGGSRNVGGGDGGFGGQKGSGTGGVGTDGSALIYEINHAETTLTLRSWTDTWNNI